jgi:hypothetical protein
MTGASLTEEDQGGIESYESGSGLAYSTYGGKRKTRGKRNSRKRSQRKSKRYMKKMYRGGDNGEKEGELQLKELKELKESEESEEQKQDGGRRRRKGKMNKGKTRKGKVSKWITHVKNFSRANKMDFRDALKDPKCKASYHKMK